MSEEPTDPRARPHLPNDPEYIRRVAGSIPERGVLEFIEFTRLNDALQALGIDEDPYAFVRGEQFDSERIDAIIAQAYQRLQEPNCPPTAVAECRKLWDYLAEGDELAPADLIFVFGSRNESIPREAARLWKEGLAPRVMFTGGTASYQQAGGAPEAEEFALIARAEGVPADRILTETASRNTPENAVNGKEVLSRSGPLPGRIILITFPYHMRRAYLTFKAVADWSPALIRHPAPYGKSNRDEFVHQERFWKYVCYEYIKLYGARLMRHF